MNEDLKDFVRFMKRREEAGRAYVCGDSEPLRGITTWNSPATFFGPKGGWCEGADKVWADYENGAHMFEPGSSTTFETVHRGASGEVAFSVGFQRALVRMRGKDKPVPFNLRITEIFRREDGEWKLVHRHADPLAEIPEEKKARAQVRRPSRSRKLLAAAK